MLPSKVEVLVAGGGPTGLVVSSVLRRAGREVLTLDRQAEGANASRAAAIHARTLEVLDELEVTDTLVAEGVRVPWFSFRDRDRLLARLEFAELPTRHPFILTIQQYRTERILLEGLRAAGGDVLRPYEVTEVRPDRDGATVTVLGPDGVEQVRARFVIGADGTHSRVRQQAGISFLGGDYPQSFVLADAVLDEWPLEFDEVQNFFSPSGIVVSGPLPEKHRRVLTTVDEDPAEIDVPFVQGILDERGPTGAKVGSLSWTSRFRVHHRVASTFRLGPVLLAGDAAHVHSPAGGQGMNLGIQDAVDLGHTIADFLTDRAPGETALDGYEARRKPIAKATVRFTNAMTSASIVRNRPAQLVRDAVFALAGKLPPVRHRMALHMAELS